MAMSREQRDDQAKAYGRVVAKAWSDATFKQQLLADPATVLKAEGVPIPEGTELRMMENTDNLVYLTLPARPATLSDEQLGAVAGGNAGGGEQFTWAPYEVVMPAATWQCSPGGG